MLFFSGAVLIKIQLAMVPPLSIITNSIALGMYLGGYILWLIQSLLIPNRTHPNESWYGVNSFKKQFTAASIIGLIGTITGIASIFFPLLIIPTCWIFLISNICWLIGEYQKTTSPHQDDPDYQPQKQLAYYQYVKVIMIVSLVTAVITTITFFFSPFIWAAVAVAPILALLTLKTWYDAHLVDYPALPHHKTPCSYEYIQDHAKPHPQVTPTLSSINCENTQNSVPSPVPQLTENLDDDSSHSRQQTYQRKTS